MTAKRYKYTRAWYLAHKEQANAASTAYYARSKKALNAKRRAKYAANREEACARSRKHYATAADKGKIPGRNYPTFTRNRPKECECCGRKQHRRLGLDHCHNAQKFRGWLCLKCNAGIGLLGDSALGVRQALRYLERNS